jgi:hypothetical protein
MVMAFLGQTLLHIPQPLQYARSGSNSSESFITMEQSGQYIQHSPQLLQRDLSSDGLCHRQSSIVDALSAPEFSITWLNLISCHIILYTSDTDRAF